MKIISKFENIDIKLFKLVSKWLYVKRAGIYVVVILFLVRETLLRLPYINLVYIGNQVALNIVFVSIIIFYFVNYRSRTLFALSIVVYLISMVFTLFDLSNEAEIAGNFVYTLLLMGVIRMIYVLVLEEYGKTK